jgi:hypothetical protein
MHIFLIVKGNLVTLRNSERLHVTINKNKILFEYTLLYKKKYNTVKNP